MLTFSDTMARGDFWLAQGSTNSGSGSVVRFQTKAGQTAIKAGEPVIQDTSGDAEYVQVPAASVTTSDTFVGFAVSNDTVTSSADGYVDVLIPSASTLFRGKAKTPASLSAANLLTKVVIDLTSSTFTIDESTTTNGFCLMTGFDSSAGTVDFLIDMTEAINA